MSVVIHSSIIYTDVVFSYMIYSYIYYLVTQYIVELYLVTICSVTLYIDTFNHDFILHSYVCVVTVFIHSRLSCIDSYSIHIYTTYKTNISPVHYVYNTHTPIEHPQSSDPLI